MQEYVAKGKQTTSPAGKLTHILLLFHPHLVIACQTKYIYDFFEMVQHMKSQIRR